MFGVDFYMLYMRSRRSFFVCDAVHAENTGIEAVDNGSDIGQTNVFKEH